LCGTAKFFPKTCRKSKNFLIISKPFLARLGTKGLYRNNFSV
jgi:hypothetical protein